MDELFELLKIIFPALIVFGATYFLIKNFLENESRKRLTDIRQANQSIVTPIRLQAYERITLFLERIAPNSLVMRVYRNGMSAKLLHGELIKTIREEFEHNISQQIYMSNAAWEVVRTAKEETTKLVNIAANSIQDSATGLELSQKIIEISGQLKKLPTQVAVEAIKKEIGQAF